MKNKRKISEDQEDLLTNLQTIRIPMNLRVWVQAQIMNKPKVTKASLENQNIIKSTKKKNIQKRPETRIKAEKQQEN